MTFQKAVKKQVKLRIALIGPSGSGKTYSALRFAKYFGGRVAVIDSERNSASLYADIFDFDCCPLIPPYSAEKYTEAIKDASGYDVLVIDSWSHAWTGEGGILDFVSEVTAASRSRNAYTEGWRKATPLHNRMVDTVLAFPGHVIVTMRTKTEYVMEENDRGKKVPRKIGLAPIQRDGIEYEFDIVADLDLDHTMTITKTRLEALAEPSNIFKKPGRDFTNIVLEWADSGVSVPRSVPVLQAEIKALEREIYVDEQGAPILDDRKAARMEHLGEDGGQDREKLTAYRNFLKAEVAVDKKTGEIAPPQANDTPAASTSEGGGHSLEELQDLWNKVKDRLPSEVRTEYQHVIDTADFWASLTKDGIEEEWANMSKYDTEAA